jgi:two-component system, cell cycle sensor histidine kinase and response regulator CckA
MEELQNILVVDDDEMVLRYVTMTLKRKGYRVHQATSGDDGLQYFTEHRAMLSMILTDIIMPGLTGPQMVERILAVEPAMPITFMTGTAAEARLPRPQSSTYKLIHKPFTPQKLLDAVRDCLADGG